MTDFDAIVVGAGVIGLAVARELAAAGMATLILERNPQFGAETSSRNSEVIHAGIYYPPGTLKAQTCIRGREKLYDFCALRSIAHVRCGKIIVGNTAAQISQLEVLGATASSNGVLLTWLDAAQARRLEPQLRAAAALFSPETGLVDSHSFMGALIGEAQDNGAQLVCRTRVARLARDRNDWAVWVNNDKEPAVRARWIINAAGLDAQLLASSINELPLPPKLHLAKGSYFVLSGHCPFTRLIYPVPEPGGLGIHLTLDLSGRARFGPDVEWVDQPSFGVDAFKRDRYAHSIAQWWPEVRAERLSPDFAGVRPKLSAQGEPTSDYKIEGPTEHGLPGLINLFGIESPGLTSSLAIAEIVTAMACVE